MDSGLYLRMFSQPDDTRASMLAIGVCPDALDIMLPKMRHLAFMVRGLDPRAANILKQEMLAVGGEAATSYHVICDLTKPTDCLLAGTERQFSIALPKLACQPFGLAKLASDIERAIHALSSSERRCFGPLELGNRTIVMGILNVTPDSFSGDGTLDVQAAIDRGLAMSSQGAGIIDVGGESTRPGASQPSTEEELARVIPVIEGLAAKSGIPISIDSRNPEVVRRAIAAGACIVNLVGGIRNEEMARVIADSGMPVILMHMQGEPGNMQQNPDYLDVVDDIVSEMRCQISLALDSGIASENIAIDPGIGFGKTLEHNLEILRRLGEFRVLGAPIVTGTSRKSFIGKVLGTETDDRLEGSIATAVLASAQGADIVRAHDVMETVKAIRLADAVSGDKQLL
jgi:dihydropteroate synthase